MDRYMVQVQIEYGLHILVALVLFSPKVLSGLPKTTGSTSLNLEI